VTSRENGVAPDGVRLDIDGRWLELPIHEDVDVDVWARDLVDDALRAREVEAVKGKRRAYADMFTELLAVERAAADEPDFQLISVYCYVPDAELFYTAMARLAALVLPEGSSLDDAVGAVVAPADRRYGSELVGGLDTASGPCIRVQQLVLDPETGGDSGSLRRLSTCGRSSRTASFSCSRAPLPPRSRAACTSRPWTNSPRR
jgi:hypothetical protein